MQRQLVGAFADGLVSDRLRLKVMRDNQATVQEAINTARGEKNLFKRFNLRTGRDIFFYFGRGAPTNGNRSLSAKKAI